MEIPQALAQAQDSRHFVSDLAIGRPLQDLDFRGDKYAGPGFGTFFVRSRVADACKWWLTKTVTPRFSYSSRLLSGSGFWP
jgi:hypothetical protein